MLLQYLKEDIDYCEVNFKKNVFSSPSQITEVIFLMEPAVVKTAVSKGHGLGESKDYGKRSMRDIYKSPVLYTLRLKISFF
jgi:hypothetical protein